MHAYKSIFDTSSGLGRRRRNIVYNSGALGADGGTHNDTQHYILYYILLYYVVVVLFKNLAGGVRTRARATAVFSSRFSSLRIYRHHRCLLTTAAAAARISFDRFLFFPQHNSIMHNR